MSGLEITLDIRMAPGRPAPARRQRPGSSQRPGHCQRAARARRRDPTRTYTIDVVSTLLTTLRRPGTHPSRPASASSTSHSGQTPTPASKGRRQRSATARNCSAAMQRGHRSDATAPRPLSQPEPQAEATDPTAIRCRDQQLGCLRSPALMAARATRSSRTTPRPARKGIAPPITAYSPRLRGVRVPGDG